ncbi:MAG: hypothetical protein HKN20_09750 [Gemmatimonadetes bacterium]|nr:hypothetical protein [Gemmatimonadota bacterium]
MKHDSPSPFAKADPDLRIKEGAPPLLRPTRDAIARFPDEANRLIDRTWAVQDAFLEKTTYDLRWMENKHFLLAGATGAGLGCALACAVLHNLGSEGSLTIIARDLKKSIGFETGRRMKELAEELGLANRFHWVNSGLAIEGDGLADTLSMLREAGADRVIYANTVAAAHSGLLPDCPPIYVKDIDEEGLFQWKLEPLDSRMLDMTRYTMGELAVHFAHVLELEGIKVEATAFADWRGSLHREGRHPESLEYGKNGAYSASLALPKDFLQEEAAKAHGTGRVVVDFFYPIMRTRALGFIPGGIAMSRVYDKLMKLYEVPRIDIPELAVATLDYLGKAIQSRRYNPFPRLDAHEHTLDLWFFDVIQKLNNRKDSPFYYKHWTESV